MTRSLFTNVRVRPLRDDAPTAAAVLVDNGLILQVFLDAPPVTGDWNVVDCQGGCLLPGLVDAHCHLFAVGEWERWVDLRGVDSAGEAAKRVGDRAATQDEDEWIRGQGWDDNLWADSPGLEALDHAAGKRPVILSRVDGHAVWVNSAAIERLQAIHGELRDVAGGEVSKDSSGAPTGVFVDRAMMLFDDVVPRDSAAQIRADFLRAQELYLSAGLTGAHDMSTTPQQLEVLRDLERSGDLHLNVSCYLFGAMDELRPLLEGDRARPLPNRRLHVAGVKLFVDGALGSHGAAMLEPYLDRTTSRGLLVTEWEDLYAQAKEVNDAGWQVAIHAIGDRANRLALDCIEQVGGVGRGHRVEHAQIVHPSDVSRFSELGAVASMQPVHWASDHQWLEERLSSTACEGAYAWRSLEASGALLALGSDAPIESPDPWAGIQAAVARPGSQALTLRSALQGYSTGSARAVGASHVGDIAPGMTADFTLVDRDPFSLSPEEIGDIRTIAAVTAGRVHSC